MTDVTQCLFCSGAGYTRAGQAGEGEGEIMAGKPGYTYDRYVCHYCGKEFPSNKITFHGSGKCVNAKIAKEIDEKRSVK